MKRMRHWGTGTLGVGAVAGLALWWGVGLAPGTRAQDAHAGHDHDHDGEPAVETGAGGDDHAGHDHGEEAAALVLSGEQRAQAGIGIRRAGPGSLHHEVRLTGEIVFNEDRVVHLVPRVAGIAREVHRSVGDAVEAGEVLAVIESRELADAKAEFLAAAARAGLAEKNHARERALRDKQVSSEQDYLEAEQRLAEARIVLRSAQQKLHALGLTPAAVDALDGDEDAQITRYEIRAPMAGVVTERHISLGESVGADTDIFTVVDLASVWVNLAVHARDLAVVRRGQGVDIRVDHSGAQAHGEIAMVTPFAEEATRSATARVVLDNRDGRWVPGTFVSGSIRLAEEGVPVVVPRDAVQHVEGRDVVFVEHAGGFEPAPVETGRADRDHVEIVAGLAPGTPYVAEGAFQLKATVVTRALGSHAGHGH